MFFIYHHGKSWKMKWGLARGNTHIQPCESPLLAQLLHRSPIIRLRAESRWHALCRLLFMSSIWSLATRYGRQLLTLARRPNSPFVQKNRLNSSFFFFLQPNYTGRLQPLCSSSVLDACAYINPCRFVCSRQDSSGHKMSSLASAETSNSFE